MNRWPTRILLLCVLVLGWWGTAGAQCTDSPTPTATPTPTVTPTPTASPTPAPGGPYLSVSGGTTWLMGDGYEYETTVLIWNKSSETVPVSFSIMGVDAGDFSLQGYNTCSGSLAPSRGCYYRIDSDISGAQATDVIVTEASDAGSPYSVPLVTP